MSSSQLASESHHSESRLMTSSSLQPGLVDRPSVDCTRTASLATAAIAVASTTAPAVSDAAIVPKPLPAELYRSVAAAADAVSIPASTSPSVTEPISSAFQGGGNWVAVRLRHLLAGVTESGPCASLGYCLPLAVFLHCSSEAEPLDHVANTLLANTYALISEMLEPLRAIHLDDDVLAALRYVSTRLSDQLNRRSLSAHPSQLSPQSPLAIAPPLGQRRAPVQKGSSLNPAQTVPSPGPDIDSPPSGQQHENLDEDTAQLHEPRPALVGSPLYQADIAEDMSITQVLSASSMRQQEATWLSDLFSGTNRNDLYAPPNITVWRHVNGRSRVSNLRLLGAQLPRRFVEALVRFDIWGKDQYFVLHAPERETAKVKGEIAFQAIKSLNLQFHSGAPPTGATDVPLNLLNADFVDAPFSPPYIPPRFLQAHCWLNRFAEKAERLGITLSSMSHILTVTTAGYFTHVHCDPSAGTVFSHIITGEKVFYFLRPSAEMNLAVMSTAVSDRSMVLGRDVQQEDVCRITFRAGDSYLIPGTWPHAVYTPVPTCVVGSTHYHDYNLPAQIRQWEHEQQLADTSALPYFPLLSYWSMKDIGQSLEQVTDKRQRPLPPVDDVLTLVDFVRKHTADIVELARGDLSAKDVQADCDAVSGGVKAKNS